MYKEIKNLSSDYIIKNLIISNTKIQIIYNETTTSIQKLNEEILKYIIKLNKKELKDLINNLPTINLKEIKEYELLPSLTNNLVIIIIKNKIYSIEEKNTLDRSISEISSELSIGGSKDSFTENYNSNIGLIRKRIKSEKLKIENTNIGRYTNTKIGILYINDICNNKLVKDTINKLNKIDIDGIIDSSYLKKALEQETNLFPTIIQTERPDKCSMALLEGKIVIITENSPYALILPSFFIDFFHTPDDYYQKSSNTTFIRLIRLIAFIIAITTPGIYIAVTTRNYTLLPHRLLMILKAGRTYVPFPAYIEALFMIVCFEILKEADLRMSSTSNSAISILGGLILGDAAVSAGIVSPIMIIVTAISSIAGLIFSSLELVNTIRFYKILLLILGSISGIQGIIIGLIFLIINLYKTKIFNYKYLSIDKNELKDSIIKVDEKIEKRRKNLTNNIIRGRYK